MTATSTAFNGSEFSKRERLIQEWLIYSGATIALLFIPGGLLLAVLGKLVNLRDVLLVAHIGALAAYLIGSGLFWRMLRFVGPWLLLSIIFFPAYKETDYLLHMRFLICMKWYFMWFDWFALGYLVRVYGPFPKPLLGFILAAFCFILADAGAGFVEYKRNTFVLPLAEDAETLLGNVAGKDEHVQGYIRVRGLQRDVFTYANVMAMGMIGGFCLFRIIPKRLPYFAGVGFMVVACAFMLMVCGGRSAFYGILFAGAFFGLHLLNANVAQRNFWIWAACMFAVIGTICYAGIGTVTEFISHALFSGSHIGDTESAWMRQEKWEEIFEAIERFPQIAISGAPIAALFDRRIDPILHVADNHFIWFLYHVGVVGITCVVTYFGQVLLIAQQAANSRDRSLRLAGFCWMLYFCMGAGEALARESLMFVGSMPLFMLTGYLSASTRRRTAAPGSAIVPAWQPAPAPELALTR